MPIRSGYGNVFGKTALPALGRKKKKKKVSRKAGVKIKMKSKAIGAKKKKY